MTDASCNDTRIGTSSEADGTQTNRTSDKLSLSLSLSLSPSLSLSCRGVYYEVQYILYIYACILPSTLAPDVNWRMLRMLTYDDVCWRMLPYADVCWHMLMYADVCWRMLTLVMYADALLQLASGARWVGYSRYMHIHVLPERERERERDTHTHVYVYV